MKVLIVEDQIDLLETVTEAVRNEGFVCETATDFTGAEEKIMLYKYDILVVDINLPGDGNGLELIHTVKKQDTNTGIIVISARNSLSNKLEGLELGADDYITKPFDMAELVARMKSLMRRRAFQGSDMIRFGPLETDVLNRRVFVHGKPVDLTKSEFDILVFFLSNQNRVLTRQTIAEHIWGDNMDLADSFDFIYSHIKNLRKKIKDSGGPNVVRAVYGIGYKLSEEG